MERIDKRGPLAGAARSPVILFSVVLISILVLLMSLTQCPEIIYRLTLLWGAALQ